MFRRSLSAVAALSTALLATAAGATTYNFTSIPLAGYAVTAVAGINASGQALIGYGNPSPVGVFVYSYPSGTKTFVNAPLIPNGGNTATLSAGGINNAGTIVGTDIQTQNGSGLDFDFDGYIDTGGSFTFLSAPGAVASQLVGINNSGEVWGLYNTAGGNGVQTYFTYDNGAYTVIGHAGYSNVSVVGLDDAGDVIGDATVGGVRVGFIDSGGVYSTIDAFGAAATTAQGVSPSGLIVGNYFSAGHLLGFEDNHGVITSLTSTGIAELAGINDGGTAVGKLNQAGFSESNGVFSSVVVPGFSFDPNNDSGPLVITKSGLIGGSYYSGNGFNFNYTAYIAAPQGAVPEPGAWAMMLIGLAGLGAIIRSRRRAWARA